MKKILFIMRYPLEDKYNLKPKLDGQLKAAVNLGYEVHYIAYDHKYTYLVKANDDSKQILGKTHFGGFSKYRNTFGFYDLFVNLRRAIKENDYALAYMRSKLVNYTAVSAIKDLHKKGGKLIVEIPSYLSQEYIPPHRRMILAVCRLFKINFEKQVDLYTLIGPDGNGNYKGKPAINIENGVCLDTIPAREPNLKADELHILALAGMRTWHGYDRLIKGLAEYKGDRKIVVDMVGGDHDGSLAQWKTLAENLGVAEKVIFHGSLYGEALTDMINSADIGAGTLAIHRTGIFKAAVLKIREYTSRGLPFIYGYEDISLNGNETFALNFPTDDSAIDIERVVSWYDTLPEKAQLVCEMRDYAQQNMSWEAQLSKAFERFVI